jgi:fatty-acyl-CoA synthase
MSAANDMPLSPLGFLSRAAEIHPDKTAVVDGESRIGYGALWLRARRLASALVAAGVSPGDRVAVLAPNSGAMIEAHFGVPLAGAVLTAINLRLEPASVAFILRHSRARLLIVDGDCSALALADAVPARG